MENNLLKFSKNRMKIKHLIFYFLVFAFSCKTSQTTIKKDNYQLKRFQSKKGGAYIRLLFFDRDDVSKEIPAFFNINGVWLESNITSLVPEKKYHIESSCLGYKTQRIENIMVKKGDSIIIKVFMKEYFPPID